MVANINSSTPQSPLPLSSELKTTVGSSATLPPVLPAEDTPGLVQQAIKTNTPQEPKGDQKDVCEQIDAWAKEKKIQIDPRKFLGMEGFCLELMKLVQQLQELERQGNLLAAKAKESQAAAETTRANSIENAGKAELIGTAVGGLVSGAAHIGSFGYGLDASKRGINSDLGSKAASTGKVLSGVGDVLSNTSTSGARFSASGINASGVLAGSAAQTEESVSATAKSSADAKRALKEQIFQLISDAFQKMNDSMRAGSQALRG
jgi:hypothetical protein